MSKPNKISRRSMHERAEEIFNFIEKQDHAFSKSKLKEIGFNPNSAENWLRMIEFIQNQPRIRLISSENNTLVEKIEGKYQAMIRRVVTDDSIPFAERDLLMRNYLPSLYTREQLEIDRIKSDTEIKFPRTKGELIKFIENNNLEVSNFDDLDELSSIVRKWFIKNGL